MYAFTLTNSTPSHVAFSNLACSMLTSLKCTFNKYACSKQYNLALVFMKLADFKIDFPKNVLYKCAFINSDSANSVSLKHTLSHTLSLAQEFFKSLL